MQKPFIFLFITLIGIGLVATASGFLEESWQNAFCIIQIWGGNDKLICDNMRDKLWFEAGTGIGITLINTTNDDRIRITNTASSGITDAQNIGFGNASIYAGKSGSIIQFKKILNGTYMNVINYTDRIVLEPNFTARSKVCAGTDKFSSYNPITGEFLCTIDVSGTSGFTSINNMAGGNAKILATNASQKANLKSLTAGTGISLLNGSTTVTISATGMQEINSIEGGSARLLKSNSTIEAVLKSLTCTGVTGCTNGTNTITIRSEVNTISGGTAKITKANSTNGEVVIKSLTQGTGITITNGTDTITIAASGGGSGIPKPTQSSPKKWGQVIPISATANLLGLLNAATLDGTETYTYSTARNSGVISSATGTVAGGNAGISILTANRDVSRRDQNSYLYADVSMSAITGQRIFIGFSSSTTLLPNNLDTIVNAVNAFGVCIRTTDTLYQRCENDGGGTGTYTSLGVTEDTNFHTFEIYAEAANNRWCIKVDGGAASCATTDIPAATQRLLLHITGETSDTTGENFIYSNIYVENDR